MSLPGSNFIRKLFHSVRSFFILVFAISSGLTILSCQKAMAQGDLLITPRRVVFEGAKRSVNINLANTGKDTATYAISLVQIRMKEDGMFETITQPDSGQLFADKFIRYFPRTVTLAPGESQLVKVQLVRTNELESGEYRSHFYFRSVPRIKPFGEEETSKDTSMMSVRLVPVFGITIAAIIRVGESTAQSGITDLGFNYLNDTVPAVKLTLTRSGNMSVYGDLEVDHVSSSGVKTRVGLANGVAVYTPNKTRKFQLQLNKVKGIDFKSGKTSCYILFIFRYKTSQI